jgi:hypothetical protein
MAVQLRRATAVTAGLFVVGAVTGTVVCAVIVLLIGIPHIREWRPIDIMSVLAISGFFGGPVGAIAAPLLGLLFLRRVPLYQAIGIPAGGTILGSLAGVAPWWIIEKGRNEMLGVYVFGGAVAGVVLAAIILSIVSRRRVPRGTR